MLPAGSDYIDAAYAYDPFAEMRCQHKRVHHGANVYVSGGAPVNSLEGFAVWLSAGSVARITQ